MRIISCISALLLASIPFRVGSAQTPENVLARQTSSPWEQTRGASRDDGGVGSYLDARVHLEIESRPLGEALTELRDRTDIPLVFSPSRLVHPRVSCKCAGTTVREALDRMLSGTDYAWVESDEMLLIERVEPAARVPSLSLVASPGRAAPERAYRYPSPWAEIESRRATAMGSERETGTIAGQVVRAGTLRPLANVQVAVVAAGIGALTNSDGRYVLTNVPPGEVELTAQLIGYRTERRAVSVVTGTTVTADFQLTEQALALDELVVTGTAGQARRREVGNTISQINIGQVVEAVSNVESLLQGRVPGVNITPGGGQIGAGGKIRLRGNVSMGLNNQPLIFVDGVRLKNDGYPHLSPLNRGGQFGTMAQSNPLNDINPNEIERIEVIKGPAASTLYGAEASGGVIQIFTKSGSVGAPTWTVQLDQGIATKNTFGPTRTLRGTPVDQLDYTYEAGGSPAYNGLDPWMQNGWRRRYDGSVRGGTEIVRYFVSAGFESNDGIFRTEWEDRYSFRGNFAIQLSPMFNLDWNSSLNNSSLSNVLCGNSSTGICINATRAPNNSISSGAKEVLDQLVENKLALTRISRFVTGATVNVLATPRLTGRATLGYDRADYNGRLTHPYGHIRMPGGFQSSTQNLSETTTLDLLSNYSLAITEGLVADLSVGGQAVTRSVQGIQGHAEFFPGPAEPELVTLNAGSLQLVSETRSRTVTAGFFGQAVFKYLDRYFVTIGTRVDGSSVFGENYGFQIYPKISASYVLSDEAFWPRLDGFGVLPSELKLRAAYGKAGQAPGPFAAIRTWSPGAWGPNSRFLPASAGNPDLGPENTGELDAGFDASWWNSRMTVDFTYYRRRTTDAIRSIATIPSNGPWGSGSRNVGETEGKGVELALRVVPIQTRSLNWEVGLDIGLSSTQVLSLGGAAETGTIRVGQPIPVVRGDRLRNPTARANVVIGCTDALPADAPCVETNADLGPNTPTRIISPSTTLELPLGITLVARGEYMGGHWIADNATRWALNAGAPTPLCHEARQDIQAGRSDNLIALERVLCIRANLRGTVLTYPADFFKLREVSVQIPVERFVPGASQAMFTLSGRNLYTWLNEDFLNWDPEQTGWDSVDTFTNVMWELPSPPKILTASLRVSF